MVKVKICGITNLEDAVEAVKAGADYLGFVLYPQSPRYIPPEKVGEIVGNLPKKVPIVAVVVNESPERLIELFDLGFDYIQLHGDESPDILNYLPPSQVIKAFRVRAPGRGTLKTLGRGPRLSVGHLREGRLRRNGGNL